MFTMISSASTKRFMVRELSSKQSAMRLLTRSVLSAAVGLSIFAGDAMASDIFSHSVEIDRKIDDVWSGLVTKSIIDSYYFAPISGDVTQVGQSFYYGSKDQQLISGSVIELKAPNVLKHSFGFNGEDPAKTVVTYSLAPEGASTTLTVTHEGYSKDSQSYSDIAGGWPIILNGLKAKLEGD